MYTKGEWKIGESTRGLDEKHYHITCGKALIASIESSRKTELANAQLISTAPELLEALRVALVYISELEITLGGCTDEEYHKDKPHNIINQTINKAEGK